MILFSEFPQPFSSQCVYIHTKVLKMILFSEFPQPFSSQCVYIHTKFGEALQNLKSIKLGGNIIYGCFDIHKQPSLDHPLLKHHKIQLKPSIQIYESTNKVPKKGYKKRKIGCPKGTVPILRQREEDVTNPKQLLQKHFNPFAMENARQHAGGIRTRDEEGPYRGLRVAMTVHQFYVGTSEATFAQAFLGSYVKGQLNYIQAGWMINPGLLNDTRPWSFGFFQGSHGGCYNTMCKGFVQVSKDIPIAQPQINLIEYKIHQDIATRNWWITQILPDSHGEDIGYWPEELFSLLGGGRGAEKAGFGGLVEASTSGHSPPMGNGLFATRQLTHSAAMYRLGITDRDYVEQVCDKFKVEVLQDSNCYNVNYMGYVRKRGDDVLLYGGPGGVTC